MKHKNNVQIEHLKGLEALRFWELKTVVGKFNALGIPVMLVKGAVPGPNKGLVTVSHAVKKQTVPAETS